ncbi:hypothetical protein GCM10009096_05630 [Parasphingorhabdus litoris]|uniref:Uncharacterized protein n=1 Tax=Parasphingorhabdus litoris TaxID=394733 RepID=A0ABN1A559_9SPHN
MHRRFLSLGGRYNDEPDLTERWMCREREVLSYMSSDMLWQCALSDFFCKGGKGFLLRGNREGFFSRFCVETV